MAIRDADLSAPAKKARTATPTKSIATFFVQTKK